MPTSHALIPTAKHGTGPGSATCLATHTAPPRKNDTDDGHTPELQELLRGFGTLGLSPHDPVIQRIEVGYRGTMPMERFARETCKVAGYTAVQQDRTISASVAATDGSGKGNAT